MMILTAFALGYAGWVAISLRQLRHARLLDWRNLNSVERVTLATFGSCCLALSCAASIMEWGAGMGTVAWFGILTVSATSFVLLLALAPQTATVLAPLGIVAACVLRVIYPS